ncbi:MAG: copper resistance protein CopB [Luteitalea sp.]|nr:copper resistance protein CopB [Luteitalea sp.]
MAIAWSGSSFAQSAPAPSASSSSSPSRQASQRPAGHQHHQHPRQEPAETPRTSSPQEDPEASYPLPPNVPPLTDADREAAFPDVQGHKTLDNALNYFLLFDQLEGLAGGDQAAGSWDTKGWIGWDRDRFWFRTEGEGEGGRLGKAEAHLLYGRAIARWWDVVAGIRQDFEPGPAQTWAAIGIQGLAPYWFEVEATAYVGASGRTRFRLETEYELLLTNRLILQPLVEVNFAGKSDPERGIGAGLSTAEAGLRLRYEVRRELAPYIGVVWNRKFFGTADYAEAANEETRGVRFIFGVRFWR